MEKETRRITIDQVAEALGVSKTTVSRAISGSGLLPDREFWITLRNVITNRILLHGDWLSPKHLISVW